MSNSNNTINSEIYRLLKFKVQIDGKVIVKFHNVETQKKHIEQKSLDNDSIIIYHFENQFTNWRHSKLSSS